MVKTDALAQLKDISLPPAIGWWPLAPSWYVVIFLVLSVTVVVSYLLYKRHLNSLAKKKALLLLKVYQQNYERDHNAQLASSHISELLKRVALVYFPRTKVASIYGDAWVDFLNQSSKGIDFYPVKSMLLDSPFKTAESVNLQPLFNCAELWIKQRTVPCSN